MRGCRASLELYFSHLGCNLEGCIEWWVDDLDVARESDVAIVLEANDPTAGLFILTEYAGEDGPWGLE